MKSHLPRIIVICDNCKWIAPCKEPTPDIPHNNWNTDDPCPKCRKLWWVAHDTERDAKTGQLLDPNKGD